MVRRRDLHYFVSRIINPHLNFVIVLLRSNRVVYGRDGYTGLRWTNHTLGDFFASELEEWRDALWNKYKKDFFDDGRVLLGELLDIMVRIEARLEDESKDKIMHHLWEMVDEISEYLGLEEYTLVKKEEFESKVKEIREHDAEIKKVLEKSEKFSSSNSSHFVRIINPPDFSPVWVDIALAAVLVGIGFMIAYLLFGKGWVSSLCGP